MKPFVETTVARSARPSTDVGAPADRRAERAMLLDLERVEGQALFGFAIRLGLTEVEAQDAVQESLLRLWTQLRAGKQIEQPRNWTFRTLYRIAMDEHRLRRRTKALLDRFGRLAPRSWMPPPPDLTDVWAAVDRLSGRQRQVIYLRYQADLAFEEIGTVLGISTSAARSHGTLAIAALRKTFVKGEGAS